MNSESNEHSSLRRDMVADRCRRVSAFLRRQHRIVLVLVTASVVWAVFLTLRVFR